MPGCAPAHAGSRPGARAHRGTAAASRCKCRRSRSKKFTSLAISAGQGQTDVIELLLAAGAPSSGLGRIGHDALQAACEMNMGVIMLLLSSQQAGRPGLQEVKRAARTCLTFGQFDVAARLLLHLQQQGAGAAGLVAEDTAEPARARLVLLKHWGADAAAIDVGHQEAAAQEREAAVLRRQVLELLISVGLSAATAAPPAAAAGNGSRHAAAGNAARSGRAAAAADRVRGRVRKAHCQQGSAVGSRLNCSSRSRCTRSTRSALQPVQAGAPRCPDTRVLRAHGAAAAAIGSHGSKRTGISAAAGAATAAAAAALAVNAPCADKAAANKTAGSVATATPAAAIAAAATAAEAGGRLGLRKLPARKAARHDS